MSKQQAIDYLISNKLLSPSYEKDVVSYDKSIEKIKIDLYKNYADPGSARLLRRKLSDVKRLREKVQEALHSLDRYTLEGSAEIAKQEYILSKSVYNNRGKRIKIDQRSILDSIIQQTYRYSVGIEELREFARTDPWRSLWSTKKTIFRNSVDNWTDEQRTLYAFSYMYDNVYKHPECPPDVVIQDDDLLDGWQLVQKEKYEQRKKEGVEDDGLRGDSVEKFVMLRKPGEENLTDEEIKERARAVYNQNSVESKLIIKERENVLKEKGKVKETELPDVKRDLGMKTVNMIRKNKGGK